MPEQLEERAKQFITEQDGNINVDWETLAKTERDSKLTSDSFFKLVLNNILRYLHEKGLLVYDNTPESYFATGAGVPLNPRLSEGFTRFSFANEQDAREYYASFFREAQYSIILHKTIGIVEKAKD